MSFFLQLKKFFSRAGHAFDSHKGLFHQYDRLEDRTGQLPSRLYVSLGALIAIYLLALPFNIVKYLLWGGIFYFGALVALEWHGRLKPQYYSTYLLLGKRLSFGAMLAFVFLSIKLWYVFDAQALPQLVGSAHAYQFYFFMFSFDIDGLSINFIPIIGLVFLLCLISYWPYFRTLKSLILLAFLYLSILIVFLTANAFIFYVFFELTLIPMVVMLLEKGHRARRIKAFYYFFLLTLFGSFCLLFGIVVLYCITGSFDYRIIYIEACLCDHSFYGLLEQWGRADLNPKSIAVLLQVGSLYSESLFYTPRMVWLPLALAFAVKIPIFPFHIWLPEAHVEAPTLGSVILASLLLKLGGYGFIRFLIHLVPSGVTTGLVFFFSLLCVGGVLYASLIILAQNDLKRIIAYSSVAHMNFAILGVLSLTKYGFEGGYLLLISHCFVSAGLFFSIGVLYERYHTRAVFSYSGLSQVMPFFAVFFLIFSLSNFAFPGTSSFPAELLIIIGLLDESSLQPYSWLVTFLALGGVLFSAIYSMYLFSRIIFGAFAIRTETNCPLPFLGDLDRRERFIFLILGAFIFLIGFYPEIILNKIHLLTDLYAAFFEDCLFAPESLYPDR